MCIRKCPGGWIYDIILCLTTTGVVGSWVGVVNAAGGRKGWSGGRISLTHHIFLCVCTKKKAICHWDVEG